MTPSEFRHKREQLDLSVSQIAQILNVDQRTVRRWEQPEQTKTGRPPNPTACRFIDLMLCGAIDAEMLFKIAFKTKQRRGDSDAS